MLRRSPVLLTLAVLFALPAPAARAASLEAGVGRADITPPTGYYMMGWVRSDALVRGQHTRLWARVVVLREGRRKVALVAEDLNGIAGGMLQDAARRVGDLGFSERNVLDSASHTHAAPSGFYNFATYNTVFMTIDSPTSFNLTGTLDPQLYAFEVGRLALAIRRANANLRPAAAGWGRARLTTVTENRSVEAHLADHGIRERFGTGSARQDPDGVLHTIDPEVNVLRVDRLAGRRRVPVGVWSTFADHGTVNKASFRLYNEDHHGAATQVVEAALRRAGRAPARQDVVNVYGNTDEGDQSAGLHRSGPAAADAVGRAEARAMLRAWRRAGRRLSRRPALALRWTRMCFCGQETSAGPVDSKAVVGSPLLTGSEEGRGGLFDLTRTPFEGRTNPVAVGPQGHKEQVTIQGEQVPKGVPLVAVRVGDEAIVSVPGEMTKEMGTRVRRAVVGAAAGSGIARAVISGLANEYLSYFTTPEEYDAQHYEGGSTLYGRTSSVALEDALVGLTRSLVRGAPAPPPYPYDPTNGVKPTAPAFGRGATRGTVLGQPAPRTRRLTRPAFRWRGAPRGLDRPLDRAFVTVERRTGGRWRAVTSDLGLAMVWTVDTQGAYRAAWQMPLDTPTGSYRFRVTANRYRIVSRSFRVLPSNGLSVQRVAGPPGEVAVRVAYPSVKVNYDLTARPAFARRGTVGFRVGGRRVAVHGTRGRFAVRAPGGGPVTVPAGAARDAYGNGNGRALR